MKSKTKIQSPKTRSDRGFSLIELSVIIGILASLAIGYMQWIRPPLQNNAQKIDDTRDRMREISNSLVDFTVVYKRLPCPADPAIRVDGTREATSTRTENFEYGQEGLVYSASGLDCPFSVGTIPVQVLNLPYDYIYDEWGNQITYHVSPNLCGSDANVTGLLAGQDVLVGCGSRDYEFGIDINSSNEAGNLVVQRRDSTVIVDDAAFVLVSHGPNGRGSYLESGIRSADSPDANESENTNSFTTATDLTYVKDQATADYDDLVDFRTKEQILMLSRNFKVRLISKEDCEANSQAIQIITSTEFDQMNTSIDEYEMNLAGGEVYNQGGNVILGILMELQNACADDTYYGEAADSDGWSGTQCPGGAPPPVDGICTCNDGSWDGTC